jgi:hypothetical protein
VFKFYFKGCMLLLVNKGNGYVKLINDLFKWFKGFIAKTVHADNQKLFSLLPKVYRL